MKNIVKKILQFILFFGFGGLLFWLAYRDQDMDSIFNSIINADLWWIVLSLVLGIISHLSRAIRWNILISALGYKPRLYNTFLAIMVMYLANLAFPRLGEVSRTGIINRYEKVPFTQLLGTVFLERVVDALVLLILLIIVLITQSAYIVDFLYANLNAKMDTLPNLTTIWLILFVLMAAGLLMLYLFYRLGQKTRVYKQTERIMLQFWAGILTIKNMKRKWAFIFHSFFIFTLYFLMIYVTFYAFEFTAHLNFLSGLAVFVMASLGMVAPAPGGVGTWHFMTYETLFIYGVALSDGKTFALAAHGAMTIMLIVVGFLSLIALPLLNKTDNKTVDKSI